MEQLRPVSKRERILFPLIVLGLCVIFAGGIAADRHVVPRESVPESGGGASVADGAARAHQHSHHLPRFGRWLKLSAEQFLNLQTLGILFLGAIAFSIGTAAGVLMGKLMNFVCREPVNPLIGAAGVSAAPMAARVANKVGQESDPHNFLLMHAMGPNVAGVLGSAVAAGVLLALLK